MAAETYSKADVTLKKTLIYVGAFVLGTAAFLAIASLVLVAIMKGVLPSEKSASASAESGEEVAAATATPGGIKPPLRVPPKKRAGAKSEEEDQ